MPTVSFPPRRIPLNVFVFGLALASSPLFAADLTPEQIAPLLARRIIDADLPMQQVQEFTESRVPRMPKAESRQAWQAIADRLRADVLEKVVFRGEAARWRKAPLRVEHLETIPGGDGYRIKKLRYEAAAGLWIPALLYEPTKLEGKVPVSLNVNGHDRKGKAADYKQIRCINQAKRGMLALNVEWIGMGQLNTPGNVHYAQNQLDLCGTSGVSVFLLAMQRGLDVLLAHEHADPKRVAVAGLSGGGWQTIFVSSLDTRVTLCNPVAGYSSFLTRARHLKDLGDSEQTPSDLATVADYTHLTAMLAPRAALLTFNAKDNCCFEAPYALPPLVEAARPVFKLYDAEDRLRTHVNEDPGTHNFEIDNRQALYRMLRDNFYGGDDDAFPGTEIDVEDELKTSDDLHIELPEDNATLNSIALSLAKSLPQGENSPSASRDAEAWLQRGRKRLAELVKYHPYDCQANKEGSTTKDDVTFTWWRLQLGDAWTIPAVEVSPAEADATVLVLADDGRISTAKRVAALVGEGKRVLAIDPFYFGESHIADKDFLFAMLAAAFGERPLGIQASQTAAVARWAKKAFEQPVTVLAEGPRTGVVALVAGAVEDKAIEAIDVYRPLGSFKQLLDENETTRQMPEMFCFGLLAEFDVLHIAALARGKVRFHNPSPRAAKDLAD
ncbi:MAG: hypothetical protein RIC55_29225 [Pirellulaceae bacterium]